MYSNRYSYRNQCGQWLKNAALLLYLLHEISLTFAIEDAILSKYEPIAMDESVYIARPYYRRAYGSIGSSRDSIPRFSKETGKRLAGERFPNGDLIPWDEMPGRVMDSKSLQDLDALKLTPRLTQLITQPEERSPTFFKPEPAVPTNLGQQTSGGRKNSKILASYNIMIPMLIPAVKRKTEPKPEPRMVKEVVTEMVPVETKVPVIQEVYKTERVPQEVVTDFVEPRGVELPGSTDDKVQTSERIVATEVKDYV